MNKSTHTTTSAPQLKTIEWITKLLDSKFTVGKFKFGLDPILNLIPFAGDGVTALTSLALVYTMSQHGASSRIVVKMLGNILIDTIVGAIPIIGWIFDFYYKSNEKNLRLLKEYYQEGKHQGSAKGILTAALIIFLILIAVMIWVVYLIVSWLWALIF